MSIMSDCTHEETRVVLDTPIADPETSEFLGRFDVVSCAFCGDILDRIGPTEEPPPEQ